MLVHFCFTKQNKNSPGGGPKRIQRPDQSTCANHWLKHQSTQLERNPNGCQSCENQLGIRTYWCTLPSVQEVPQAFSLSVEDPEGDVEEAEGCPTMEIRGRVVGSKGREDNHHRVPVLDGGLNLKPPMTPGTTTDYVSKSLHHKMYCNNLRLHKHHSF